MGNGYDIADRAVLRLLLDGNVTEPLLEEFFNIEVIDIEHKKSTEKRKHTIGFAIAQEENSYV